MRIPIEQLGGDALATIPNIVEHPLVKKYGMRRYTLDRWRREGKLDAINISTGSKQAFWKSTVRDVLKAIKKNLGIDTKNDQAALDKKVL